MLTVVDEYTRKCLDIPVKRSMKATDVHEALKKVIADRGHYPVYIRSDNGSEFIAQALQTWLGQVGIASTFIEPGSPWQNGKCESFNGHQHPSLVIAEPLFENSSQSHPGILYQFVGAVAGDR